MDADVVTQSFSRLEKSFLKCDFGAFKERKTRT